jgi:PrtD family type I secretion system ABC transporter
MSITPRTESPSQQVRAQLRSGVFAVGIFSLFVNLLLLTTPLYMMQIADRVLISGSAPTLLLLTGLAFAVMAISAGLDFVRLRLLARLGARFDRQLSGPVFDLVIGGGARSQSSGRGQPLRDLETLRAFISGNGLTALCDAPWTPLFLIVIFLMHPWLGLVALAGMVLLLLLTILGALATRRAYGQATQESIVADGLCEGSLRNAEIIAALGMLPALRRRWDNHHAAGVAAQGRASERNATFLSLAKFVRPTIFIAILGTGALLVLDQVITAGAMIAASILMGRALAPVEGVIANWRQVAQARAARDRLMELLNTWQPIPRQVKLPRPDGLVALDGVIAFAPGHDKAVIKGVGFSLAAGESLGIIGPSAAGKSTLARLLLGILTPQSGSVRLDGAEICQWRPAERDAYLGYLPQDVALFEGNIAENICRFGDAESEAIVDAAKLAGAHAMILSLPQGYETAIGAGGAGLSGGQRQQIALARALYGNPALVVLDEPNANLDGEGEWALSTALDKLRDSGTTTIVIAHRPSVLKSLDKLMVLRDGQVEHFGPRDQVLAKVTRAVKPTTAAAQPTPISSNATAADHSNRKAM